VVLSPSGARVRLRISARSGSVTVNAEQRTDVVVEHGGTAETTADGAVEIRPLRSSASIEVRCPEGADVMVGTRSGSVNLRGHLGSVSVTSQSGSIKVSAAQDADLRTASGSAELDECAGRCRASTKSGRVVIGVTRDVAISTMSGSVEIASATGTVELRAVSGSVEVGASGSGPVRASTVSGSMTIRLPAGARPALRSSGRGRIDNSFESGDDIAIDVTTISGSLRLIPE